MSYNQPQNVVCHFTHRRHWYTATVDGCHFELDKNKWEAIENGIRPRVDHFYNLWQEQEKSAKLLQSTNTTLQNTVSSITAQCNQAKAATAAAESRCQVLANELQMEKQKITVLTQQNATLLTTQTHLQQELQIKTEAMHRMATDIAELKQALQDKQIAADLSHTKTTQLAHANEKLENELKESKLRLAKQAEEHNTEIRQLCAIREKEVSLMFRQIQAAINQINPATSSNEDF